MNSIFAAFQKNILGTSKAIVGMTLLALSVWWVFGYECPPEVFDCGPWHILTAHVTSPIGVFFIVSSRYSFQNKKWTTDHWLLPLYTWVIFLVIWLGVRVMS